MKRKKIVTKKIKPKERRTQPNLSATLYGCFNKGCLVHCTLGHILYTLSCLDEVLIIWYTLRTLSLLLKIILFTYPKSKFNVFFYHFIYEILPNTNFVHISLIFYVCLLSLKNFYNLSAQLTEILL